jgi:hypothetical protein
MDERALLGRPIPSARLRKEFPGLVSARCWRYTLHADDDHIGGQIQRLDHPTHLIVRHTDELFGNDRRAQIDQ